MGGVRRAGRGQVVQALTLSFIRLHVPQSVIQIVNILDADSLVDFFSVCKRDECPVSSDL